jgi:hypothetical protein
MRQTLRSRGFALTTLVAFLVAQPVVGCLALCLLGTHHPAAHAMAGMAPGGSSTVGTDGCHASNIGAVQRDAIQPLSPMEPVAVAVIAFAPARSIEPAHAIPAAPAVIFPAVESPPPRTV